MKTSLMFLVLVAIGLCSCGQSGASTIVKDKIDLETQGSVETNKSQKTATYNPGKYINAESIYTDSIYNAPSGIVVRIQNSFPRGGPYIDPSGKSFGQAIFWTRVINESETPIELSISFPADSFAILPTPESYLKLYLPPNIMAPDKESMYNYGATGLKSFLDTGIRETTYLRKTLDPKEECLFNIGALSYQSGGIVRAGLIFKDQALFYKIGILPHFDSEIFPCGQIGLKKKPKGYGLE